MVRLSEVSSSFSISKDHNDKTFTPVNIVSSSFRFNLNFSFDVLSRILKLLLLLIEEGKKNIAVFAIYLTIIL